MFSTKNSLLGSACLWTVLVGIVLFLVIFSAQNAQAADAIVRADILNVRDGPGLHNNKIDEVKNNQRLPVLEKSDDWYKVRLPGEKTGWVAGEYIKLDMPRQGDKAEVTASALNVRNSPALTAAKTGEVANGEKVAVLDTSGDWCKIRYSGSKTGWVAGWFLKKTGISPSTGGNDSQEVKEKTDKIAIVTADILNVRSGPGVSNSEIAEVSSGDELPIIGSSGGWCKVSLPGGKTGWVAGWHVKVKSVSTGSTSDSAGGENGNTGSDTGDQSSGDSDNVSRGTSGKEAVVTADILNVRSGPDISNGVIGKLERGDRLPIIDSTEGWCKVKLPGGGTGWIAGWLIEVRPVNSDRSAFGDSRYSMRAVVDATNVNVRQGPGREHSVITQVDRGAQLSIIEKAGNWYKVKLGQGVIGWIADWLLNIERAGASTPEQQEVDSRLGKLAVREANGRTVVTIETTGPMGYDIFTLTDPDRVVVDLKGVDPSDLPQNIEVNSKLVDKVRTSEYSKNPDIVRLVFDVKEPVMFSGKEQQAEDGERLVVEMYVPELGSHLHGKVITLDPGHGGHDSGARGPSGLQEKEVNLDVALMAAHLLRQNGAKVVLTRSTDTYVGLEERTRIADDNNSDVFVSIHMNSNPSSLKSGTSTYYRRDNISGLGVSQADNKMLAQQLQAQLLGHLYRDNVGVKQANFVVLRTAKMPSALIEASFLSNSEEESLMRKDIYRSKIAEAVAEGVANYFKKKAR